MPMLARCQCSAGDSLIGCLSKVGVDLFNPSLSSAIPENLGKGNNIGPHIYSKYWEACLEK